MSSRSGSGAHPPGPLRMVRVLQLGHEAQDVDDLCVQVSVIDDAIIATLPGTSYSVTYHKRNEPWLLTSDIRDVAAT